MRDTARPPRKATGTRSLILGWAYANGDGVPVDEYAAAAWYRKAADQGHKFAQFNMGRRCNDGDGVPVDKVVAVAWNRKAAEQGIPDAQYYLALAYLTGDGVPMSKASSLAWLHKAAQLGHAGCAV